MKKSLILLLLTVLAGSAYSQTWPVSETTGKISFTEVVESKGTRQELFTSAKTWFVNTFNSAKDVIQMEDKEAGIIIAKGLSEIYLKTAYGPTPVNLKYQIKVDFKDNKYRYEVTDLYYSTSVIGDIEAENYLLRWNEYGKEQAIKYKISQKMIDKTKGESDKLKVQYNEETLSAVNRLIDGLKKGMNKPGDKADW